MVRYGILLVILTIPLILLSDPVSAGSTYDCETDENRNKPTRIELRLAKKLKKNSGEIKEKFRQEAPDLKLRIEYLPFLDPPMNIGIGKCVSAAEARFAIHTALEYNRGIETVILQEVIPHHWVGIGTTKLAELSWMPIVQTDLERLMDPSLTTEAFQTLYRKLARMTERKRPFGFDPVPYEYPKGGPTVPVPDAP